MAMSTPCAESPAPAGDRELLPFLAEGAMTQGTSSTCRVCHPEGDTLRGRSRRSLKVSLAIIFVFMACEVVGGVWANSLALITDAAHMLTDAGSVSISIIALWLAKRPSTQFYTYGYHRAEILGALLSALTIWLLSGIIMFEAAKRITNPPEVEGMLVFVVATLGLCANIVLAIILHGGKHHSINVHIAFLHVLGDLLQSVGILLAGLVMWVRPSWNLIDPLCSIGFACIILFSTLRLIKQAVDILMMRVPHYVNVVEVLSALHNLPGVVAVEDLHIWAIVPDWLALSVHIQAEDPHITLQAGQKLLRERFHIHHSTIQCSLPDPSDKTYQHCCLGGVDWVDEGARAKK